MKKNIGISVGVGFVFAGVFIAIFSTLNIANFSAFEYTMMFLISWVVLGIAAYAGGTT